MGENKSRLYFAYGTNLNEMHIRQKCSGAKVFKKAKLAGNKISFHGYSSIWDGATETVIADAENDVWGILYQMDSAASWDELDQAEDARIDGTGAYFHYPVQVTTLEQETYEASIYKKAVLGKLEPPSQEYFNIMIKGAEEQGLPEVYINSLRMIETKVADYPVPRRRTSHKWEAEEECSGCQE